ncbi:MAG: sigma-70 family RNA polymerase sigma factor [Rhodopirellula sp.]|nr:sigma-70 family RNA polymerase sigma factor [Rhodopirellula sp.]
MQDQNEAKSQPPFTERLRAGDNDAWALFYQKYERRVRRYLAERIRNAGWSNRADSGDVWGSLVASLLRRLESDKEQLAIEKMTNFVMGMARNKWRAQNAKQFAKKRDRHNEIADSLVLGSAEQSGAAPVELAMAREEYERFMNRLDEMDRRILDLELQGYSTKDIAERIERSQRTVQLRLEKIDYLFAIAGSTE